MPRRRSLALLLSLALFPLPAAADDFAAGSLIVPMDVDYQDMGMLKAYGLVYELLRQGVPVRWVIKPQKQQGDVDFTADAVDVASAGAIKAHGYRGGPWVVDAADAAAAMPVVEAWQTAHPETAVHEASSAFSGDVSHLLVVAPTIAMMADGNQKIARKYMIAAGIPDSTGDLNWPDASPDMLDPDELSGASLDNHHDGALFDEDGDPVYCQFMSMHWAVKDAQANPEVVAEMREFLAYPTHFFAECQAVNAFENLDPHGYFLTQKGFLLGDQPKMYDYFQTDTAYAQLDGPFMSVGGSEPAYTLPEGEQYKATDIVMITEAGTPIGVNDVWMTGYLDGICPADSAGCLTSGKVSYLGGHEYDIDLPISDNPTTQGTRLFLNSLFEAPCATAEGLPMVSVVKTAPAVANESTVEFTIEYINEGAMPALEATLTDTLPAGVTFVSATNDGSHVDGVVSWPLGNLGEGEKGSVSVTVELGEPGVYVNSARVEFRAGVNILSVESNQTMTAYGVDPGTTGNETSGGTVDPSTGGSASGSSGGSGDSVDTPTEPSPTTHGGETSVSGSVTGDSASDSTGMDGDGGCSCRDDGSGGSGAAAMLLGLALLRRRRAR